MWVSRANSKFLEFAKVNMPIKDLKEHSYTILDTTEGQIMLNVNHYGDNSEYGHLGE